MNRILHSASCPMGSTNPDSSPGPGRRCPRCSSSRDCPSPAGAQVELAFCQCNARARHTRTPALHPTENCPCSHHPGHGLRKRYTSSQWSMALFAPYALLATPTLDGLLCCNRLRCWRFLPRLHRYLLSPARAAHVIGSCRLRREVYDRWCAAAPSPLDELRFRMPNVHKRNRQH